MMFESGNKGVSDVSDSGVIEKEKEEEGVCEGDTWSSGICSNAAWPRAVHADCIIPWLR